MTLENVLTEEASEYIRKKLQDLKEITIGGKLYHVKDVKIESITFGDIDKETLEGGNVTFKSKFRYLEEMENNMGWVSKFADMNGKVHIEKRYIKGIIGEPTYSRADFF